MHTEPIITAATAAEAARQRAEYGPDAIPPTVAELAALIGAELADDGEYEGPAARGGWATLTAHADDGTEVGHPASWSGAGPNVHHFELHVGDGGAFELAARSWHEAVAEAAREAAR